MRFCGGERAALGADDESLQRRVQLHVRSEVGRMTGPVKGFWFEAEGTYQVHRAGLGVAGGKHEVSERYAKHASRTAVDWEVEAGHFAILGDPPRDGFEQAGHRCRAMNAQKGTAGHRPAGRRLSRTLPDRHWNWGSDQGLDLGRQLGGASAAESPLELERCPCAEFQAQPDDLNRPRCTRCVESQHCRQDGRQRQLRQHFCDPVSALPCRRYDRLQLVAEDGW